MDNVIFYLPSPASQSQPPRVPGALAAATRSDQSIASKAIDQTASQLDPHDEKWTISMSQHRDEKDFSPKRCTSVPRGRTVGVDEQGMARSCRRNYCYCDFVENLTAIQEFPRNAPGLLLDTDASLSSMQQTNSSASAIPTGDSDDGFADIDEILSSIPSKSTSASKDSEADHSSQSTTSVDSRRAAPGSTQSGHITFPERQSCLLTRSQIRSY
jgi:hypothetical protein